MSSFYDGPHLTLRESRLDRMLDSPSGEVGRYLHTRGQLILTQARSMVGVRTGNLRRSLHMRHGRGGRGQYIEVGSPLDYALLHHDGIRPHLITPDSGRVLRFGQGGRLVHTRRVIHPGARGRKYLTIPLRRVIR